MAVTLTIDDLKYPDGELQPVMLDDIDTALTTWLSQATTLTDDNETAEHYVYWKGYNAAATRIAMRPSSQSTNQGSHSTSWSDNRVSDLRKLANHHKDEYERLIESVNQSQPRAYFGRVRS